MRRHDGADRVAEVSVDLPIIFRRMGSPGWCDIYTLTTRAFYKYLDVPSPCGLYCTEVIYLPIYLEGIYPAVSRIPLYIPLYPMLPGCIPLYPAVSR